MAENALMAFDAFVESWIVKYDKVVDRWEVARRHGLASG